jgi:hypothetical protein
MNIYYIIYLFHRRFITYMRAGKIRDCMAQMEKVMQVIEYI